MAELIKSKFSDWTLAKLGQTFHLKRVYHHALLQAWLDQSQKILISTTKKEILIECQEQAQLGIDSWTEEEIKREVIYPIFSLVRFTIVEEKTRSILAKAFAERDFEGTLEQHKISGRPDGLIAKGEFEPQEPYFCFHEYKRQETPRDGLGQLLSAMLMAQTINTKERPIYGAYVIGRQWFFTVLMEKVYVVSKAYDVAGDDIFDIYRILQQLKLYVIQFLKEDKDL